MDVIIRGGLIVDGTGAKPFVGDVAIEGDRIAAVGPHLDMKADKEVDATGKVVIPGLIDPHVHEEWICLVDGTYEMFMRQGVSTVVNGNCGHSIAPGPRDNIVEYYYGNGLMSERQREVYKERFPEWNDFDGYAQAVEKAGSNLNLCTLLGHGTIRWTVMNGAVDRPPTKEEADKIESIIRHNMEQGAWGISYGLDYVPSRYAKPEELAETAGIVADYDGVAAAHLRHSIGVLNATKEFLQVGRDSGCKLQISHLRSTSPESFKAVQDYVEAGGRALIDTIPATTAHCQSKDRALLFMMSTCDELFDQGLEGIKKAIKTPEGRALLRNDPYFVNRDQTLNVLCMTDDPALEGKTVAEAAGDQDPKEFLLDLLASDQNFVLWAGGANRPDFSMKSHTPEMRANPYVCAGSDEILGDPEMPYDWYELRRRGAMPIFIQEYLKQGMPIEEVIRRNTSMVADHFDIVDRGRLQAGKFADVAVIDMERYHYPNYENPDCRNATCVAEGVENMFVNGIATVQDGKVLKNMPGRVLRHASKKGGKA